MEEIVAREIICWENLTLGDDTPEVLYIKDW